MFVYEFMAGIVEQIAGGGKILTVFFLRTVTEKEKGGGSESVNRSENFKEKRAFRSFRQRWKLEQLSWYVRCRCRHTSDDLYKSMGVDYGNSVRCWVRGNGVASSWLFSSPKVPYIPKKEKPFKVSVAICPSVCTTLTFSQEEIEVYNLNWIPLPSCYYKSNFL